MKKIFLLTALLLATATAAPTEVNYKATDSINVYADYTAVNKSRATIILFHQANGSRLEYEKIAPRLNTLGFSTLAVDQRSGGSEFGGINKTAAQVSSVGFLGALPDLEASLKYAKTTLKAPKVIIWGSSYSSALVFLLAAKNPKDVAGLLAFSPDEYLGQPNLVRDAAKKVTAPVFITSAASEVSAAKAIFNATSSKNKTQFIPKGVGKHGSSVLSNPLTGTEYWVAVEKFLSQYK
jgi:alpha-beta hydrolase superfamily lysophospholipase